MLLRCPSANDISRSIVSGARSPMETTYSVGAYDIGETAQCARVLNDGVVVHCRKGSIRAAEIVFFKRIVARQPADDVGQRGPADVGNDLLKKHPAVSPDTSHMLKRGPRSTGWTRNTLRKRSGRSKRCKTVTEPGTRYQLFDESLFWINLPKLGAGGLGDRQLRKRGQRPRASQPGGRWLQLTGTSPSFQCSLPAPLPSRIRWE